MSKENLRTKLRRPWEGGRSDNYDLVELPSVPFFRVVRPQRLFRTMSDISENTLERSEAVPATRLDAAADTSCVGTNEDPVVVPAQGVRPQSGFISRQVGCRKF